MTAGGDRDGQTRAEERLVRYLGELREHPPEPDDRLVVAVLNTARWQGAVRPYLGAVGVFAGAFVQGAGMLLGRPRRR